MSKLYSSGECDNALLRLLLEGFSVVEGRGDAAPSHQVRKLTISQAVTRKADHTADYPIISDCW